MLYKHSLSPYLVYVIFFGVVCLYLLTKQVGQVSFNNIVLFILVVLTGHHISNNDLYICIKLLYASLGSIADNTEV